MPPLDELAVSPEEMAAAAEQVKQDTAVYAQIDQALC